MLFQLVAKFTISSTYTVISNKEMKLFKADLHIHTVLSPCASLEMSPKNIVNRALEQELDIIAITDHNSTRQCQIVIDEAEGKGLQVYRGVEVTSKEEIHCLAYFETAEEALTFQTYIDKYLPCVKNNPSLFGYQIVVDKDENIIYEEDNLLCSALTIGIDQLAAIVHELNGVFIPAHVNKGKDSIISQLGFIPRELKADGFEITIHERSDTFSIRHKLQSDTPLLRNSDAHDLESLGKSHTILQMESAEFSEFRYAMNNFSGRKVVVQ